MADACQSCEVAAVEPCWSFAMGCRTCCARSIARSPQFFEARKAGDKLDRKYRALLEQIGGLHKPAISHAEVVAAFKADAVNKTEATT
jgi:hypothetical protein